MGGGGVDWLLGKAGVPVRVPNRCYGTTGLFMSSHFTSLPSQPHTFRDSKTTQGCRHREKSHSTLPTSTSTLNILPHRRHLTIVVAVHIPTAPHQAFRFSNIGPHSTHYTHSTSARLRQHPLLVLIPFLERNSNSTSLSAFHRSSRPALLGRRDTTAHTRQLKEKHIHNGTSTVRG
jgi:hypothetical protein